jgi:hypothetical protein
LRLSTVQTDQASIFRWSRAVLQQQVKTCGTVVYYNPAGFFVVKGLRLSGSVSLGFIKQISMA